MKAKMPTILFLRTSLQIILISYLTAWSCAYTNTFIINQRMKDYIFTNDKMMEFWDLPYFEMCFAYCNNFGHCRAVSTDNSTGRERCIGYIKTHTIADIQNADHLLGTKYFYPIAPRPPACVGANYILTTTNQCIRVESNIRKTQNDAYKECNAEGGNLIIIDTLERLAYFKQNIAWFTVAYYIGADDIQNEGEWRWWNGSLVPMSKDFWSPGSPDNRNRFGQRENCAVLYVHHSGRLCFHDITCTLKRGFICEKPLQ